MSAPDGVGPGSQVWLRRKMNGAGTWLAERLGASAAPHPRLACGFPTDGGPASHGTLGAFRIPLNPALRTATADPSVSTELLCLAIGVSIRKFLSQNRIHLETDKLEKNESVLIVKVTGHPVTQIIRL